MKNDIVSRNFNFIGRNDQKYDNNLLERQVNNIMLHFESDIKHGVKNPFIIIVFLCKKTTSFYYTKKSCSNYALAYTKWQNLFENFHKINIHPKNCLWQVYPFGIFSFSLQCESSILRKLTYCKENLTTKKKKTKEKSLEKGIHNTPLLTRWALNCIIVVNAFLAILILQNIV